MFLKKIEICIAKSGNILIWCIIKIIKIINLFNNNKNLQNCYILMVY